MSDLAPSLAPMRRDAVIATLRDHSAELRRFGVSHLFLFGSVARDEARPASDVDLFFDFDDPRFSAIELLSFRDRVHELFDRRADVMTRSSLHPRLRSDIEQSAFQVF